MIHFSQYFCKNLLFRCFKSFVRWRCWWFTKKCYAWCRKFCRKGKYLSYVFIFITHNFLLVFERNDGFCVYDIICWFFFQVSGSLSYGISKATVYDKYNEKRLMLRRQRGDTSKEYLVDGLKGLGLFTIIIQPLVSTRHCLVCFVYIC